MMGLFGLSLDILVDQKDLAIWLFFEKKFNAIE